MFPDCTNDTSRREFLESSAAALATLWLLAEPSEIEQSLRHALRLAGQNHPAAWEALAPEDAADIEAMAEQILPTDETPGAREGHVINFIDHSLANWASAQKPNFLKGLAALNAEVEKRWPGTGRFAKLSFPHQTELLKEWDREPPKDDKGVAKDSTQLSPQEKVDKEHRAFFEAVRTATITGMFANPSYGGNTDKMGWKLLNFDDRGAWQPPFGAYDGESAKGGR